MILGAVIAGGKARRFGSDKAHAMFEGTPMIRRVAESLSAQTKGLIICGREEPGFTCIPDLPKADLGPLGGINAALHYARDNGYDAVLSAGCDIPNLPADLVRKLAGPGAAIICDQPVVGYWPVSLAPQLEAYLNAGNRRVYGFAKQVSAREVVIEPPLLNVNRPEDLP